MSVTAFFTAEAMCEGCWFRVSTCGFTAAQAQGCTAYSHRKGQEHANVTGHDAVMQIVRRTDALDVTQTYQIVPR